MNESLEKLVQFVASSNDFETVSTDGTKAYGISQYGYNVVGDKVPPVLKAIQILYKNGIRDVELKDYQMNIKYAHDGKGSVTDNLVCTLKPLSIWNAPSDIAAILAEYSA